MSDIDPPDVITDPVVLRLLTEEEIDFVAGGHTSHSMGSFSSHRQGANSHFSQGAFTGYEQRGTNTPNHVAEVADSE